MYQTAALWFDNFSFSRLMPLFDDRVVTTTENMDHVLDKIVINLGDNRIIGKSSDLYTEDFKREFDNAIVEILNNGEISNNYEFNWLNIFRYRAVVYEYVCTFNGSSLPEMLNGSLNKSFHSEIGDFNKIILIPDQTSGTTNLVFYNSDTKVNFAYSLTDSDLALSIYNRSTDIAGGDIEHYISSEQSGFDIFYDNVFIPGWQENTMDYENVVKVGLYRDESMAEKNAEAFFDNPVAKWSSSEGNSLTYSDENTVVKYNKDTHIMEYYNYRVREGGSSSFANNYIAALNTIAQDSFIENEVYLDSYSNNNGKYTFCFNYKLNDRLIIPDEALKEKMGITAFIEITVEGGRLEKYTKYAYGFENDGSTKRADCGFVSAIDQVYTDEDIEDIKLCYTVDDAVELNWIVDISGNSFKVSVESEE